MAKSKKVDVEALIAKARAQPRAQRKWEPNDGEAIAGTIERMKWVPGEAKDEDGKPIPYLVLMLRDFSDNELTRVTCGVTLQEEIEIQGVKLGDTVAIVYHGREGRTGIYSLSVDRE